MWLPRLNCPQLTGIDSRVLFRGTLADEREPIQWKEADIKKPLEYPSHPFAAEWSRVVSALPEGLAELALKRALSIEMTLQFSLVGKVVKLLNEGARTADDVQFINGFSAPDALAELADVTRRMSLDHGLYPLEACLALAAIFILGWTFDFCQFGKSWLINKHNLLTAMLRAEKKTDDNKGALLWCQVVALEACYSLEGLDYEGQVLANELSQQGDLEKGWETVMPITMRFFWTAELNQRWRRAWNGARRSALPA